MKLKDALNGLILWLTTLAIIFIAMALGDASLGIVGAIALIAWIVWLLLAFRDAERAKRALDNPVIWMEIPDRNGNPVLTAMDGSGRTRPRNQQSDNQPIFDQEGNPV